MDKYDITIEELFVNDKKLECSAQSIIDDSIKTSEYFNEYNKLFSLQKNKLNRLKKKQNKLYLKLQKYFSGKDDPEVYKEKPLNLKLRDAEVKKEIEVHPEYEKILEEVEKQEEIVDHIERVLSHIKERGYAIKNAIDFIKFQAGM